MNMLMQLQKIEGQTFVGANIQLDGGVVYVRCKFISCILLCAGMRPIHLQDCSFENPNWMFNGPPANAFSFLSYLYANGHKESVEKIFESIRKGAPQSAMMGQVPNSGEPQGPIQ